MSSATAPQPSTRSSPGSLSADIGVYVHWPFCEAKCPYCDFNSHVARSIDHGAWQAAFRRDIAAMADEIGPRRIVSVFFGGGTPSLMEPRTVAAVLDQLEDSFGLGRPEITLEANPTSVERGRFEAYRLAGVNRLSLGVQALNDADLRRLGRRHSAADALAAMETARAIFDRTSFDLIYARQDQSLAAWRAELSEALALEPDHLSLYQLTIEPETRFGALWSAGRLRGLPDADLGADLFDDTQELCEAAGLPAYEISNHARPGAECRHNLVYWTGGAYLGIGPGAHGRITTAGQRWATEAWAEPGRWLRAVAENGRGERQRAALTRREIGLERLLMGLRLRRGVPKAMLDAELVDWAAVGDLVSAGFLDTDGDALCATKAGARVLNKVLETMLR